MKLHEKFNNKKERKRKVGDHSGSAVTSRSDGGPSLQMHTIKYLQMADLQKFVI